jgi:hypothetical protein
MSALTNIQALLKRRYGPYINPLPSVDSIAQYAKFRTAERVGENYNFPVKLGLEHGVTHNVDGTAFALKSAVDSVVKNAQLDGATIMLIGNIPYDVVARMAAGREGSYMEAVDYKVESMMEGGELYRELALLYGPGTAAVAQAELAVVNASISGADLNAGQVINITQGSWSSGLWNHMVNARVEIYEADGSTLVETEVTVVAVPDSQINRLELQKTGSANVVAAGHKIIARDAKGKSCTGLQAILENQGVLFNIDAGVFPQWQAVQFDAGGPASPMTVAKLAQLFARLKNNGAKGGGKYCCSAAQFAQFTDELDNLDRYIQPMEMKQTGMSTLVVKSPIGPVTIEIHEYMKQGIAMFFCNNTVRRIGATDLTFRLGMSREWFWKELDGNAGSQMRIYSHQAPVIEIPYHCAIVTSIESDGDTAPA